MWPAEEAIKNFEQYITHGGWCDMYESWQNHNLYLVKRIQANAMRWVIVLLEESRNKEATLMAIKNRVKDLEKQ